VIETRVFSPTTFTLGEDRPRPHQQELLHRQQEKEQQQSGRQRGTGSKRKTSETLNSGTNLPKRMTRGSANNGV